jgi:hypothetical protein
MEEAGADHFEPAEVGRHRRTLAILRVDRGGTQMSAEHLFEQAFSVGRLLRAQDEVKQEQELPQRNASPLIALFAHAAAIGCLDVRDRYGRYVDTDRCRLGQAHRGLFRENLSGRRA